MYLSYRYGYMFPNVCITVNHSKDVTSQILVKILSTLHLAVDARIKIVLFTYTGEQPGTHD